MKIPSGQEAFNYTIDQSYLKDYELLIWAVKKSNYMLKNNIFSRFWKYLHYYTFGRHLDEANNCNGIASNLNSYSLIFSCLEYWDLLVCIKSKG